jgi:hypothetical protein
MAQAPESRKSDDIVVFRILRDSTCAECKEELWKGSFLRMEKDRPLCLSCADLDHLVYLPSGDTALTRRASKHSALRAVVVRFSRSRGRYERQGILVESDALEQAERECLSDADSRERQRERAAERRAALEEGYVAAFAARITSLYPGCPPDERIRIAEHACHVGSGRVGRSEAAKHFEAPAIDLAVRAHIRHVHTRYDELLARGAERHDARDEVRSEVARVLARWRDEQEDEMSPMPLDE